MGKQGIKRTIKSAIDLQSMSKITWQDLIEADFNLYNDIRRAATEAWQKGDFRYVCSQCEYPVYAPNDKNKRPHWRHFGGAPPECPWWTGNPRNPDSVSASKFSGQQEGPLHFKIKHLVADILLSDPRADQVEVEKYVKTEEGRRKPDVYALYDGAPIAFEIQLATTQLPTIVAKETFYEKNAIRLIWLTWEFQERPLKELKQAFADIYNSHNHNLFSFDANALHRSEREGKLLVRVHAFRGEEWKSKYVALHDLDWSARGLPFAFSKEDAWQNSFKSRWLIARKREQYNWELEEALLVELSDRLNVSLCPTDWHDLRFSDLLDALYSLQEGRPVVSRQKNLVELANTFLGAERHQKFAQIVQFAARYYNHHQILKKESVEKKLQSALKSDQLQKGTELTAAIRILFPDWLKADVVRDK